MPDSSRRGLVLAKIESTYGTDSVPVVGTDAIAVGNPQFTTDAAMVERDQILRDSISQLSAIIGRKLARLTFFCEIKGSGTAGTAPRLGVLLRACGLAATTVAATSVTYAPINSAFESCTIYWFDGSKKHIMTGCYGTVRIVEEVGQFGRFEFTMTGVWNLPTDLALPSGAVFDSTLPQPVINLGLQIGAYAPVAATLNIDLGVAVGERPDFNAAEGLRGLQITGRACRGSIDPESVTEATHAFYGNFKNATQVALSGNLIGATAGNKVAITSPKVQYEAPAPAERNQIRTYNLPIRLLPSTDALSDEISIAFS